MVLGGKKCIKYIVLDKGFVNFLGVMVGWEVSIVFVFWSFDVFMGYLNGVFVFF